MPEQEPSEHEREKVERLRRAMYSRKLSENLKPRDRRVLDLTPEIVGDDWKKEEPQTPGLTVAPRLIGVARSLLWWILIGSVLFFIAAIGIFAYYFAFGQGSLSANPRNIDISVQGPPQVAGGEPTALQIAVVNRNRVPIELAELVITYPEGTRALADQSDVKTSCSSIEGEAGGAYDLRRQRICLGTIESGGRKQGKISALFAGTTGSHADVKVELEYHVQGSSAVFVASTNYTLAFSSSPLAVSIDGNSQTVSGQPLQFTINVASNANASMKDVLLSIDYPFGFKFTSATPSPRPGGGASEQLWALGDLAPGQKKSVSIQGVLTGEQGDNRVFRLSAGTRTSENATRIETKLADNTYTLQISQPFLGLAVMVNGSDKSAVVAPGDNVAVSIAYQNNLPVEITDAVIVARLTGTGIDGSTVHVIDGFYRSSDDAVLWDKTTTSGKFASLAPGARGVVTFNFSAPESDALKSASDPSIDISVNAAGKRLSEAGVPQNLQSASRQQVKLATDLQISSQALYYANPFGSSGPIPPKAGVETTYALVFTVTNTTNKIKHAKVTATLPNYVRWIGSHAPSTEKLAFNQFDGTFTWDVGDIAPNVGLNSTPPRQIAISIGLTPSVSQIGSQPVLVREVTLRGEDEATSASITKTAAPDVTTNLTQVGKSSSNSVVGTDPGFSLGGATIVK
ncbi:hypothetical protein HY970_03535 [Candidatus Kaiserbacteria bacterium]|nr:hypothetical protein [Candidatus Kaiserbacteria bacterium]